MSTYADADFGQSAWPVPSLRRLAVASVVAVGLGFGGLLTWASLTPLDSAVSADGLFVAAGKRKTVTLLEGGILKTLLVREGDHVAAGQHLLLLDDVQLRATMNQVRLQHWGAVAKAARLDAETKDQRTLTMPANLMAVAERDPGIASLMRAEQDLFASRWDTFDGNARISGRKIAQSQSQSAALDGMIATLQQRIALTQQEMQSIDYLLARGLETRSRSLALHRAVAELQGALLDANGRLADTGHIIEQTKLELQNLAETRRSDAAKDLQEAKATIEDAAQHLKAAEDLLAKTTVLAPEAGTVTDIKFFTPGSSITPGQPILDIVPADTRLLMEAPVQPTDIEHVHAGQKVNFKLSAYKAHRVPTVEGRLVYVAADRTPDAQGNPVFLVRAELDADALKPFPGVIVYPGMPANLLIIGGERTALDFIVSPILDGMRRGMREE
jgi:HlyD family secretion protein